MPGCNFRCGFCHNPEFVLPNRLKETAASWIDESTFLAFLDQRRGLLDGVVISGGEPTMHPGLSDLIRHIRAKGFKVKLDTNGSHPEVLKRLLDEHLLDYVAMDVKTSLKRYPELVGACVKSESILESINLIREQAPDYEFRTTFIREIHGLPTLEEMAPLLRGSRRYVLQAFRPSVTLNPAFAGYTAPDASELKVIGELFSPFIQEVLIR